MDPVEREKYAAGFRRRKKEHEIAMAEWKAKTTEEERAVLEREEREKKAVEEESGKPKRPMTTFMLFAKEEGLVFKDVAKMYKNLPPSELERRSKIYAEESNSTILPSKNGKRKSLKTNE